MALTPQEIHQLDQEIFEFLYQKYEEAKEKGEEFYFEIVPHWGEEKNGELKDKLYWFPNIQYDEKTGIIFSLWESRSGIKMILSVGEKACIEFNVWRTNDVLYQTRQEALISYLKGEEDKNEIKVSFSFYRKKYEYFTTGEEAISHFLETDKPKIDTFFLEYDESHHFTSDIGNLQAEFEIKVKVWRFFIQPNGNFGLLPILPLSITRFTIVSDEYPDIHTFSLSPDMRWIFLTGENAAGKTSILSMLHLALLGEDSRMIQNDWHAYAVEVQKQGSFLRYYQYLFGKFAGKYLFSKKSDLDYNEKIITLKIPMKNDRPYVRDVVEYLYDRYKSKNRQQHYYDLIEVFKEFLPNLSRVEIDENIEAEEYEKGVLFYEQDELGNELGQVTFEQLAMGYQNILNLVANIILGLSNEKGKTTEFIMPKELYGIVIIDEFEQHLHPKMQRFLVEKLTTLFPKVQFIVSTHSPIPLLGAPKETAIFHVARSREKGITMERIDDYVDWENLTPDLMYSSPIFGFSDIIPFAHKKGEKIRTIYSYNDNLATMLKDYAPQAEKNLQGIFDEE